MSDKAVVIYASGLCYLSCCADGALTPEQVAAAVTDLQPAGTRNGWRVSADKTFKSGEPNPCVCHDDATRRHWLMEC